MRSWALILPALLYEARGLRDLWAQQQQQQRTFDIIGDTDSYSPSRLRRDIQSEPLPDTGISDDGANITTVFDLKDSHLHLMVHWAGKKSSILFCLARPRDEEIGANSSSRLFISKDYGTTFEDVSSRFQVLSTSTSSSGTGPKNATINKFFHHPSNNCYYVFTDIFNKQIFVTRDCADTIQTVQTDFVPKHVEFDTKTEGRFLVHDRDSETASLYVTDNYGASFTKVGDFVHSFFLHYAESTTSLYVARVEPSGGFNILSSPSFFKHIKENRVVFTGAVEFEMRDGLMFAVKNDSKNPEEKLLFVAKPNQRFIVAEFPNRLPRRGYHVADVTAEGMVMIIVNHNATCSNLYISDIVSEHEVKFSLSLERIMFYSPSTTWRNSWLAKLLENAPESESTFADFYKIAGLRSVYLASQLDQGVEETNIRPNNLSTLITFDAGGAWSQVAGPAVDHDGHPILGCYQETNCSLHIAQQLSRKYPATRSIPVLTSEAAPGVVLASGNMGRSLQTKTSVFLSADAGLSWHQVLQGNYYYNIGDHGGIIVAVKYFKTEGDTNILLYSTNEGLTWKSHKFYPTPIRIFGLITEPGENTTVFTMFGTKAKPGQPIDWIIVKVNLTSVFRRDCTDEDYKDWSPKAPGEEKMPKCVMGKREVYRRRAPLAECYNGIDYTRARWLETCPCTHYDYRCDYGFVRDSGRSSGCVRDPNHDMEPEGAVPAVCPPGTLYNLTKGYVRLAGDECEGGQSSRYEPELRACPTDISAHRSFLLVAQRQRVLKIDLSEANSSMVLPLIGVENVIAIDLDYESDCIYWADINTDKILRQCLSNSSKVEVLVETGLSSVEGMAFDQIAKILYFVDGSRRTVELIKGNARPGQHTMRKTILSPGQLGTKSKPRGITVHPKQGYLFYSDWADKAACIGRALLDGSNHSIIVPTNNNRGQPQVKWPNGLTVDTVAERLYWVDAQLDYISSTDLDGGNMKKVLAGRLEVSHPFAVAVLKETVYWDDWTRKAVFQADKNTGTSISILKDSMPGAMDMKIFSPHLLTETNACSNHSCSHLCIALPPNTFPSYRCLCPDGMKAEGVGADTKCVCPHDQELFSNGTCSAALVGGLCDNETQFQCGNRLCIPQLWKCDGSNDCGDMSDEADCQRDVCRGKQFQCANKKCIPDHWRCDFDQDCGDGSDEEDCPSTVCDASTQFRCNNGQCINLKWRCDLEKDCHDGSDETGCETTSVSPSCGPDHFQCPRGSQCLPSAWRCDGDLDCPDGSDESNCTAVDRCQDWQFRCHSGHCIFSTWQCDGAADCTDASDEMDCADNVTAATSGGIPVVPVSQPMPNFPRGECNEWMFKCGSEQCIPFWWKCDNVEDCSDASDEEGCGPDHETVFLPSARNASQSTAAEPAVLGCPAVKFQCHNGVCIWGSWVCDGDNDCPEGEDEEPELCRDKVRCTPGQFMCKLSGTCITIRSVCDGKRDCEDGSDEVGCTPATPDQVDDDHKMDCHEEESFMCDEGAVCLGWDQKCDGHQDCLDGSDEEMCEHWREDVAVAALEEARDHVTDHSVGVRWWPAAHSNFTHPNFHYKLSYTILGHRDWHNTSLNYGPMDQFEAEIDGLLPGTDYQIRLYVKNSLTGVEYHYAPVTLVRTRDGQPGPPRNLSATQMGDVLRVSWQPPSDPKGLIQSYRLLVEKGDGELVREERIPVTAAAAKEPLRYNLTNLTGGPNNITISLLAENRDATSQPARLQQQLLLDSLGQLEIVRLDEAAASLRWRNLTGLVNFTLSCRSDNPLDTLRSHTTSFNSVTWSGLAPNTAYTFSVRGNMAAGGHTPVSTIRVKTQGPGLPAPNLTIADLAQGLPTTVKLSWVMASGSGGGGHLTSANISYGIWYGVSEEELLAAGPRATVDLGASTWTQRNLTACTTYIFAVAVLLKGAGGPGDASGLMGYAGPRSNYKTVVTKFSPEAQPRQLAATGNVLTWLAPCNRLDRPLKYSIQLHDTVTGRETFLSLAPTSNTTLTHTLNDLQEGQVVLATVSQGAGERPRTPDSPSVLVRGPPITPPTSVFLQAQPNHLLRVSWSRGGAPDPNIAYKIIFTPDETIAQGCATRCAQCLPAKTSPLVANMSDLFDSAEFLAANCTGLVYTVAVAAVRNQKQGEYTSSWLTAQKSLMPVELPQHAPDQIVIEESNAVGTVIGVLIVIIMLVAALGYMFHKHRRLRRSFQEFAATHYSSATGSATLLDDDDESPIIRGFSDDEPLVVST